MKSKTLGCFCMLFKYIDVGFHDAHFKDEPFWNGLFDLSLSLEGFDSIVISSFTCVLIIFFDFELQMQSIKIFFKIKKELFHMFSNCNTAPISNTQQSMKKMNISLNILTILLESHLETS